MFESIDASTITIAGNLIVFVWGAAKMSAALEHLDKTVSSLKTELDEAEKERTHAAQQRANLDKRVSILERFPPAAEVRRAEP